VNVSRRLVPFQSAPGPTQQNIWRPIYSGHDISHAHSLTQARGSVHCGYEPVRSAAAGVFAIRFLTITIACRNRYRDHRWRTLGRSYSCLSAAIVPQHVGDLKWLGKLQRSSRCRWAWKSTCTPVRRANKRSATKRFQAKWRPVRGRKTCSFNDLGRILTQNRYPLLLNAL
jgi:hypothetical protein